MDCNLDESLSRLFWVIECAGRCTAKCVLLVMGLTVGALWCVAVLLCTGRLPWMVRKFL